jgi:hypothetical protein
MWVASVFAGKGNELNADSGVLHRDGDMTAQEESHETKQGQDEDRHEPRFLGSPALKVKSLPADGCLTDLGELPVGTAGAYDSLTWPLLPSMISNRRVALPLNRPPTLH